MKKVFTLSLVFFLFIGSVFSDSINQQEAKKVAETFFNKKSKTKSSAEAQLLTFKSTTKNESLLYIYNFSEGGFVIVPADDCAPPILAYSLTNNFDENIAPNAQYLLDRYNLEISINKSNNVDVFKEQWADLNFEANKENTKAGGPLLETTWNQSPYYNDYCPEGTPTGCVATAMSQIMNFYEWPVSGQGWHKYVDAEHPDQGIHYIDFSSVNYDWINMPNELTSSSTTEQIDAIATLNRHAGVSVDMSYDEEGSGAFSRDVMYALTSYFKYDPSTIEFIDFDVAEETGFINIIKNEIDNNRPVYYSGQGTSGGHAWICDGYDDEGKVHINWGWGGSGNGYFQVSAMNPGTMNFSESNSIIIGIKPGVDDQEMLWTKQYSGFTTDSRGIHNISTVSERVAWASAYDGSGNGNNVKEYTRTVDGSTWISGEINADGTSGYSISMISAINKDTAWAALFGPSGGGMIVKTTDGGANWVEQPTASFDAPNGFPNVIHFWDENNGFCQGDPNGGFFEFYTTTDGGTTWNRVPSENIPENLTGEYGTVSYMTTYGDNIWFGTNKGRVFKSTDKGFTWTAAQMPYDNSNSEITFRDENNGILISTGLDVNKAYKTTDGGVNWTELSYTGELYFGDIQYVPNSNILISTGADYETPSQGISYSTDDGATFNYYAKFYENNQFLSIGAFNSDHVWVGAYDNIWKLGEILISGNFDTDNKISCVSEDVTFTSTSYETVESWNWNFGEDATPATATGEGPHVVSYSTGGMKTISLNMTHSSGDYSILKESLIDVASTIPGDIAEIIGETDVLVDETYTYSIEEQPGISFDWTVPNPWVGNSTTNTIDITFEGGENSGTIRVSAVNGCGSASPASLDIVVSDPTGIDNIDNNKLSIYPNPASSYINIDNVENTSVYIYNLSGALIKVVNLTNENVVDVSDLPNGMYQVKVNYNDTIYSETINILK